MAQYTFTGFDASAHVAEETKNAAIEAPKAIVRSVWVSVIAGLLLLVSVTMAIQDYAKELGTSSGCRRRRSSSTPPATTSASSCSSSARSRSSSAAWPR